MPLPRVRRVNAVDGMNWMDWSLAPRLPFLDWLPGEVALLVMTH